MLEVKEISKTFNKGTINEKMALNKLSLSLDEGDFVTIIGGNGAGKSTLLNALSGVFQVDEGDIIIDGLNVTYMPEYKRAKYLTLLPHGQSLIPTSLGFLISSPVSSFISLIIDSSKVSPSSTWPPGKDNPGQSDFVLLIIRYSSSL